MALRVVAAEVVEQGRFHDVFEQKLVCFCHHRHIALSGRLTSYILEYQLTAKIDGHVILAITWSAIWAVVEWAKGVNEKWT